MNQPSLFGFTLAMCTVRWNLFIYFSPVKIRGWHPNNQHTIYLGAGRGMFWWKLKKSRETSRRASNCFVHSFQNLDRTSAAAVTKCQFKKFLKVFWEQNTFKERKMWIQLAAYIKDNGLKMFILLARRWVDPLTAFRKTTPC